MNATLYRKGQHHQVNPQSGGQEIVHHTDYIHPVYGYSRFIGHMPEGLCRNKAEAAWKRRAPA